jgi:hypothetical protein
VGVPQKDGRALFYSLTQAELMLSQGQQPSKKVSTQMGGFSPASSQAGGVALPPRTNPWDWAEEVEKEVAGPSTAPTNQSPSPKEKAKATAPKPVASKKPVAKQPEPDFEARCATRLGVEFSWLKTNTSEDLRKQVKSILEMSQKAYSVFLVSDKSREYAALRDHLQGDFRSFRDQVPKGEASPQPKAKESFASVVGKAAEPSSAMAPPPARKSTAVTEGKGKERRTASLERKNAVRRPSTPRSDGSAEQASKT